MIFLLLFWIFPLFGESHITSLKKDLEYVLQDLNDKQNIMESLKIKLESLKNLQKQTLDKNNHTQKASMDIMAQIYFLLQTPPILVMTSDNGSLEHLLALNVLKANFEHLGEEKLPVELSHTQAQENILLAQKEISDLEIRIKELEDQRNSLEKEIEKSEEIAQEIDHNISLSFEKGVLKRPIRGKIIEEKDQNYIKGIRFEAAKGEVVKCPIDSRVEFIGEIDKMGKLIILEVSSRLRIVLAGLNEVDVVVNQKMMVNDILGKMPAKNLPSFLYLEIRQDGQAIKPNIKFLD
jgi:septal ring factor EnvC (AmiA/AmiB activator)